MSYIPIENVEDATLSIDERKITQLKKLRVSNLFSNLPGYIPGEREMLTEKFQGILNILIADLLNNPSKLWVMKVFLPALEFMHDQDTEARDHFGDHLEIIMDILEIESSDGLLGFYL